MIKQDLFRYCGKRDIKSFIRYFFFTAGFRYIYFFRKASASNNIFGRLFWKFLLRQCMLRTGIQIPEQTSIGEGFRIVHFGHIVINPDAVIGRNFNICQGCLVGNSGGKRKGSPVIGNNVCLQPGSAVVGNISIGNDVVIAPNAFVNFDVPDNSVVIGNPAKIHYKLNPTKDYIVYPV